MEKITFIIIISVLLITISSLVCLYLGFKRGYNQGAKFMTKDILDKYLLFNKTYVIGMMNKDMMEIFNNLLHNALNNHTGTVH